MWSSEGAINKSSNPVYTGTFYFKLSAFILTWSFLSTSQISNTNCLLNKLTQPISPGRISQKNFKSKCLMRGLSSRPLKKSYATLPGEWETIKEHLQQTAQMIGLWKLRWTPHTWASTQSQLFRAGKARADKQVDAEQHGDEEGSCGQLQEVAVDVGEVYT